MVDVDMVKFYQLLSKFNVNYKISQKCRIMSKYKYSIPKKRHFSAPEYTQRDFSEVGDASCMGKAPENYIKLRLSSRSSAKKNDAAVTAKSSSETDLETDVPLNYLSDSDTPHHDSDATNYTIEPVHVFNVSTQQSRMVEHKRTEITDEYMEECCVQRLLEKLYVAQRNLNPVIDEIIHATSTISATELKTLQYANCPICSLSSEQYLSALRASKLMQEVGAEMLKKAKYDIPLKAGDTVQFPRDMVVNMLQVLEDTGEDPQEKIYINKELMLQLIQLYELLGDTIRKLNACDKPVASQRRTSQFSTNISIAPKQSEYSAHMALAPRTSDFGANIAVAPRTSRCAVNYATVNEPPPPPPPTVCKDIQTCIIAAEQFQIQPVKSTSFAQVQCASLNVHTKRDVADIMDARQAILDCLLELCEVKSYLEKASEKLGQEVFVQDPSNMDDCQVADVSHLHVKLNGMPMVLRLNKRMVQSIVSATFNQRPPKDYGETRTYERVVERDVVQTESARELESEQEVDRPMATSVSEEGPATGKKPKKKLCKKKSKSSASSATSTSKGSKGSICSKKGKKKKDKKKKKSCKEKKKEKKAKKKDKKGKKKGAPCCGCLKKNKSKTTPSAEPSDSTVYEPPADSSYPSVTKTTTYDEPETVYEPPPPPVYVQTSTPRLDGGYRLCDCKPQYQPSPVPSVLPPPPPQPSAQKLTLDTCCQCPPASTMRDPSRIETIKSTNQWFDRLASESAVMPQPSATSRLSTTQRTDMGIQSRASVQRSVDEKSHVSIKQFNDGMPVESYYPESTAELPAMDEEEPDDNLRSKSQMFPSRSTVRSRFNSVNEMPESEMPAMDTDRRSFASQGPRSESAVRHASTVSGVEPAMDTDRRSFTSQGPHSDSFVRRTSTVSGVEPPMDTDRRSFASQGQVSDSAVRRASTVSGVQSAMDTDRRSFASQGPHSDSFVRRTSTVSGVQPESESEPVVGRGSVSSTFSQRPMSQATVGRRSFMSSAGVNTEQAIAGKVRPCGCPIRDGEDVGIGPDEYTDQVYNTTIVPQNSINSQLWKSDQAFDPSIPDFDSKEIVRSKTSKVSASKLSYVHPPDGSEVTGSLPRETTDLRDTSEKLHIMPGNITTDVVNVQVKSQSFHSTQQQKSKSSVIRKSYSQQSRQSAPMNDPHSDVLPKIPEDSVLTPKKNRSCCEGKPKADPCTGIVSDLNFSGSELDLPYSVSAGSMPKLQARKRLNPPLEFDMNQVPSDLRTDGICHPDCNIQKRLKSFGVDNLLEASRPAKCCRKAVLNEESSQMNLPYPASLRSLPLDEEDVNVIEQTIQMSSSNTKKPKSKSFQAYRAKMQFYTNLVKDDFYADANKFPSVTPVYEVRYFEIQRKKSVVANDNRNNVESNVNTEESVNKTSPSSCDSNFRNVNSVNKPSAVPYFLPPHNRVGLKKTKTKTTTARPTTAPETDKRVYVLKQDQTLSARGSKIVLPATKLDGKIAGVLNNPAFSGVKRKIQDTEETPQVTPLRQDLSKALKEEERFCFSWVPFIASETSLPRDTSSLQKMKKLKVPPGSTHVFPIRTSSSTTSKCELSSKQPIPKSVSQSMPTNEAPQKESYMNFATDETSLSPQRFAECLETKQVAQKEKYIGSDYKKPVSPRKAGNRLITGQLSAKPSVLTVDQHRQQLFGHNKLDVKAIKESSLIEQNEEKSKLVEMIQSDLKKYGLSFSDMNFICNVKTKEGLREEVTIEPEKKLSKLDARQSYLSLPTFSKKKRSESPRSFESLLRVIKEESVPNVSSTSSVEKPPESTSPGSDETRSQIMAEKKKTNSTTSVAYTFEQQSKSSSGKKKEKSNRGAVPKKKDKSGTKSSKDSPTSSKLSSETESAEPSRAKEFNHKIKPSVQLERRFMFPLPMPVFESREIIIEETLEELRGSKLTMNNSKSQTVTYHSKTSSPSKTPSVNSSRTSSTDRYSRRRRCGSSISEIEESPEEYSKEETRSEKSVTRNNSPTPRICVSTTSSFPALRPQDSVVQFDGDDTVVHPRSYVVEINSDYLLYDDTESELERKRSQPNVEAGMEPERTRRKHRKGNYTITSTMNDEPNNLELTIHDPHHHHSEKSKTQNLSSITLVTSEKVNGTDTRPSTAQNSDRGSIKLQTPGQQSANSVTVKSDINSIKSLQSGRCSQVSLVSSSQSSGRHMSHNINSPMKANNSSLLKNTNAGVTSQPEVPRKTSRIPVTIPKKGLHAHYVIVDDKSKNNSNVEKAPQPSCSVKFKKSNVYSQDSLEPIAKGGSNTEETAVERLLQSAESAIGKLLRSATKCTLDAEQMSQKSTAAVNNVSQEVLDCEKLKEFNTCKQSKSNIVASQQTNLGDMSNQSNFRITDTLIGANKNLAKSSELVQTRFTVDHRKIETPKLESYTVCNQKLQESALKKRTQGSKSVNSCITFATKQLEGKDSEREAQIYSIPQEDHTCQSDEKIFCTCPTNPGNNVQNKGVVCLCPQYPFYGPEMVSHSCQFPLAATEISGSTNEILVQHFQTTNFFPFKSKRNSETFFRILTHHKDVSNQCNLDFHNVSIPSTPDEFGRRLQLPKVVTKSSSNNASSLIVKASSKEVASTSTNDVETEPISYYSDVKHSIENLKKLLDLYNKGYISKDDSLKSVELQTDIHDSGIGTDTEMIELHAQKNVITRSQQTFLTGNYPCVADSSSQSVADSERKVAPPQVQVEPPPFKPRTVAAYFQTPTIMPVIVDRQNISVDSTQTQSEKKSKPASKASASQCSLSMIEKDSLTLNIQFEERFKNTLPQTHPWYPEIKSLQSKDSFLQDILNDINCHMECDRTSEEQVKSVDYTSLTSLLESKKDAQGNFQLHNVHGQVIGPDVNRAVYMLCRKGPKKNDDDQPFTGLQCICKRCGCLKKTPHSAPPKILSNQDVETENNISKNIQVSPQAHQSKKKDVCCDCSHVKSCTCAVRPQTPPNSDDSLAPRTEKAVVTAASKGDACCQCPAFIPCECTPETRPRKSASAGSPQRSSSVASSTARRSVSVSSPPLRSEAFGSPAEACDDPCDVDGQGGVKPLRSESIVEDNEDDGMQSEDDFKREGSWSSNDKSKGLRNSTEQFEPHDRLSNSIDENNKSYDQENASLEGANKDGSNDIEGQSTADDGDGGYDDGSVDDEDDDDGGGLAMKHGSPMRQSSEASTKAKASSTVNTANTKDPQVCWALTQVKIYADGTREFEVLEVSPIPPGHYLIPDVNNIVLLGAQPARSQ